MSEPTNTLTMPFAIGATYWLPSRSPRQETVPCPVCAGAKFVTVLAPDEKFTVECDACGLGYHGPQGTVTEYHYDPHVVSFTIASVVRFDDSGWTVKSTDYAEARFKELVETEADALEVSRAAYLAQEEDNARRRYHRRRGVSKAAWAVRYHNDAIKKLERELAYHRSKVGR